MVKMTDKSWALWISGFLVASAITHLNFWLTNSELTFLRFTPSPEMNMMMFVAEMAGAAFMFWYGAR